MQILFVGLPPDWNEVVVRALRERSHEVVVCPHETEAFIELTSRRFDALVLRYRETATINLLRQLLPVGAFGGSGWVLLWSGGDLPWDQAELDRRRVADWVEDVRMPETLLRRVTRGLERRAAQPAGSVPPISFVPAPVTALPPPPAVPLPLPVGEETPPPGTPASETPPPGTLVPQSNRRSPCAKDAPFGELPDACGGLLDWLAEIAASTSSNVRPHLERLATLLGLDLAAIYGADLPDARVGPVAATNVRRLARPLPADLDAMRKGLRAALGDAGSCMLEAPQPCPPATPVLALAGAADAAHLWLGRIERNEGEPAVLVAGRSDPGRPWSTEEQMLLQLARRVFARTVVGKPTEELSPLETRVRDRTLRLTRANEMLRREIAERKRIQNALSESIERFELAARGTNDGLWDGRICDNNDNWQQAKIVIWFSIRFKELLGYEDWEFPDTLETWAACIHPDDRTMVMSALDNHLYQRLPYDIEYRLRTKQGEFRWYQARGEGLWNDDGLPMRMAGSLRDVTERKKSEAALAESEERYRRLVELSPDAIFVLHGTRPAYLNPSAARMLGLPAENLFEPEIELTRFVSAETLERLTRTDADCEGNGEVTEVHEDHVLRADGEELCIEWCATPIHYAGKPAAMAVARDVTERKKSEAALRAEREVLRQLLNAHERERQLVSYEIHDGLGQYLAGAVMRMEALGEQLPDDGGPCRDQWELSLHLMKSALREARRLISGLRPPILDEYGIVSAIEYLIQEPRGIDPPQIVFSNRVQFKRLSPILETTIFRIVQEGLNNSVRHGKARHVEIELAEHDGRVRLAIRDDGVGFVPEKVQGKGYGLQGIRERARLLGGKACFRSRPEGGTVVDVDLPLVEPTADLPASLSLAVE